MADIDYFFSVLSPFSYLAGTRLEQVASTRGARIHYRPMDIVTVFGQTGGVPPGKRHWSRQEYRLQELSRLSAAQGLPLNIKPAHWPTDPVPASKAVIATQQAGLDVGMLAHAFMRGVWAEERDIALSETVDQILIECQIEAGRITPHLPGAEDIYRANTQSAIDGGVFGAPFYVVGQERFWGQDRLSYLDSYLASLAGG